MKKATNALFWAVKEMERRYELLEENGLRNLAQYNDMIKEKQRSRTERPADGPESEIETDLSDLAPLPYIVVIVDELSDLMMVASKDVEFALTRLAQMARAAGIHIIIATQRPSADVLTGTIKANFPTRISFQVSSKIDGRIIMDQGGAESLLGNGDMLFCPPGTGRIMRIQGAYISEKEIAKVTGFLKAQRKPEYDENITKGDEEEEIREFDESEYDEKYDEAVAVVAQSGQASISYVQRRLRIGYNRAARLIEMMEHEGIIGPQIGTKPREILVKNYDEDRF
jgi:S-DNA-T family DNA segregation ATPase FtsK/SpoIIIE